MIPRVLALPQPVSAYSALPGAHGRASAAQVTVVGLECLDGPAGGTYRPIVLDFDAFTAGGFSARAQDFGLHGYGLYAEYDHAVSCASRIIETERQRAARTPTPPR